MGAPRRCCSYLSLLFPLLAQVSTVRTTCLDQTKQFMNGGQCCELCPPGHHMIAACTDSKRTSCNPCPSGFFSDVPDNAEACQECLKCQQDTLRACNSTVDARCSCRPGYLCSNEQCTKCVEKPVCGKGKELRKRGHFEHIYNCVDCPQNTYSDTEDGLCQKLTKCEEKNMTEMTPGNKTHDTKCGVLRHESQSPVNYTLYLSTVGTILLLLLGSWLCMGRYILTKRWPPANNTAAQKYKVQSCPLSTEEKGEHPFLYVGNKDSLSLQLPVSERSTGFTV